MDSVKLAVFLYRDEAEAIGRLAVEQRRQPAEQAAYLVRQQLEALGALPLPPADAQPQAEAVDGQQQ